MQVFNALEAGIVTISEVRIHAIRRTLDGREALCGAGPVLGLVPGRFDQVESHACRACLALAIPEQRAG